MPLTLKKLRDKLRYGHHMAAYLFGERLQVPRYLFADQSRNQPIELRGVQFVEQRQWRGNRNAIQYVARIEAVSQRQRAPSTVTLSGNCSSVIPLAEWRIRYSLLR